MEKGLKLTKEDLKGLKKEVELIRKERVEQAKQYAEWLRKNSGKAQGKQQNVLLNK
ncbi:Uncharacterised protein [uncultured archaeon]|nr:Uncharacterised protein [uncultured archaeon]